MLYPLQHPGKGPARGCGATSTFCAAKAARRVSSISDSLSPSEGDSFVMRRR